MELGYLISPIVQIVDNNGKPVVGAKIYVYNANTTVLVDTYNDFEFHLNTNPVITDMLGNCTIIADTSKVYDIIVNDENDNLLFGKKNITIASGIDPSSSLVFESGYGITVERNGNMVSISVDTAVIATQDDLATKQDRLYAGDNISIEDDIISVTGLKTISVTSPLQKTETNNEINISIDTSDIQTTLSAGTNIDEVKLSNGIIDLKHENCSASINSIAIGLSSLASGNYSFTEGRNTSAFGDYCHAEGVNTVANADGSHAEGNGASAMDNWSHAEGDHCIASGWHAHAEGSNTLAIGNASLAAGYQTSAVGDYCHAEGYRTQANGYYTHTEGDRCVTYYSYSHAEGIHTSATEYGSHAEGFETLAAGSDSHAEGTRTQAIGPDSHAEGTRTQAIGNCSHAEGIQTSAIGFYSHAEGENTIASGAYQTVIGHYNDPNETDLFQIGCGTSDNNRQNALEVKNDNSIWYNYNGTMVQLAPSYDTDPLVHGIDNTAKNTRNPTTYAYDEIYGHKNYLDGYQNGVFGLNNTVDGTNIYVLGQNNTMSAGSNGTPVSVCIGNENTMNDCYGTFLIGNNLSGDSESFSRIKIGFGNRYLEINDDGTFYKVVDGIKTQL